MKFQNEFYFNHKFCSFDSIGIKNVNDHGTMLMTDWLKHKHIHRGASLLNSQMVVKMFHFLTVNFDIGSKVLSVQEVYAVMQ